MKIRLLIVNILFASIVLSSCSKDEEYRKSPTFLPQTFSVSLPEALSNSNTLKNSTNADAGSVLNEQLATFINIGEGAGEYMEDIILSITRFDIDGPTSKSFVSDLDGRSKTIQIITSSEYDGTVWENQMIISDKESFKNEDKGIGVQFFWNNAPVKGVAIVKLYNWNRDNPEGLINTMCKIEYSETGDSGYESAMTISISDWDAAFKTPQYQLENLKMFAGKNNNTVDVYGCSTHPKAWIINKNPIGYSFAYAAAGNYTANIGLAEIGLPLLGENLTSRNEILELNSLKNTISAQVLKKYPSLSESLLKPFLVNTEAPGHFDNNGFIPTKNVDNDNFLELNEHIKKLTPYNPQLINELSIAFK